eukprot:COSAG01_NODE_461_length_16698_cov_113.458160_22_plen_206_part_00
MICAPDAHASEAAHHRHHLLGGVAELALLRERGLPGPFPSSISCRDQNRRDIGKSQSKRTAVQTMETPRSRRREAPPPPEIDYHHSARGGGGRPAGRARSACAPTTHAARSGELTPRTPPHPTPFQPTPFQPTPFHPTPFQPTPFHPTPFHPTPSPPRLAQGHAWAGRPARSRLARRGFKRCSAHCCPLPPAAAACTLWWQAAHA